MSNSRNLSDLSVVLNASVANNISLPGNVTANNIVANNNISYSGTLTGGTGIVNIGSGQIYKDANGNIGIGTSSPATGLQVQRNSANGTTYAIYTDNGAAGAGINVAGIGFSNAGAMKSSITAGVYGNDFMAFNVAGSGTTERMRIDSGGNIGIGTSSPQAKLDVRSGATTFAGQFLSTGTNTYGATTYASVGNATLQLVGGNASGATTGIRLSQGGNFELYFGGVQESSGAGAFVWQGYSGSAYGERMRLDASGNLGLGVAPSYRLDVAADSGAIGLNIRGRSSDGISAIRMANNSNAEKFRLDVRNDNTVYFQQGGTTQAMTLDASGNLGIGTNSPGARLDVRGNGTQTIRVVSDNGGTAALNLTSAGVYGWTINGSNVLTIVQDATERARIDSSGMATFNGTIKNAGGIKRYSTSYQNPGATNYVFQLMRISRDSANWSTQIGYEITIYNEYYRGGMTKWFVDYNQVNSGTVYCIGSSGTLLMKLYLGTEVTVSGTIKYRPVLIDVPAYQTMRIEVVYGTSEVASISAQGQVQFVATGSAGGFGAQYTGEINLMAGLGFPATQVASSDANTLDDYEEGTWTPTLTCNSGTLTVSNAWGAALYTKIGRQVTLYSDIVISAASSPSGTLTLGGLPFVQGGGYAGASSATLYLYLGVSSLGSTPIMAATSPGNATMQINTLSSGSTGPFAAYMQVGTQLFFSVTYSV